MARVKTIEPLCKQFANLTGGQQKETTITVLHLRNTGDTAYLYTEKSPSVFVKHDRLGQISSSFLWLGRVRAISHRIDQLLLPSVSPPPFILFHCRRNASRKNSLPREAMCVSFFSSSYSAVHQIPFSKQLMEKSNIYSNIHLFSINFIKAFLLKSSQGGNISNVSR